MRVVLRFALLGVLAALVYLGVRAITSTPTGPRVQAAFTDVHGLVVGNEVRIDGAPAGRVDAITLTDRGTALVTMRLNGGMRAVGADATAAIRPVDLLGDTYVALEPGHAAAALRGPIPTARTLNDPRLDDLLRVFRAPQRAGLKALLVEMGVAMDGRGVDLNQAALSLRGALGAADDVMRELGSQNSNLEAFLADADRVVRQGARRSRQLGTLVNSLAALLRTTASHAARLDAGLQTMPATLGQARTTASELAATARATRPLARQLSSTAGPLSTAAVRLAPFLGDLAVAARNLHPTLRDATSVLVGGDPTLSELVTGLRAIAAAGPDLTRLTPELVRAAPGIAQGFFVNFPDQASEPGSQPLDPFANPLRDYWRGAAVFSCQSFGLPIEPGCLSKFLAETSAQRGPADTHSSEPLSAGAGATTGHPSTASPVPAQTRRTAAAVQLLGFLLKR